MKPQIELAETLLVKKIIYKCYMLHIEAKQHEAITKKQIANINLLHNIKRDLHACQRLSDLIGWLDGIYTKKSDIESKYQALVDNIIFTIREICTSFNVPQIFSDRLTSYKTTIHSNTPSVYKPSASKKPVKPLSKNRFKISSVQSTKKI